MASGTALEFFGVTLVGATAEAARRHAVTRERLDPRHQDELERRYLLSIGEIEPRV